MRLSTRSTYAMRALIELALTGGQGPLSAALIARRQGLSVAYLEQLLHRLRQQGLVGSLRGPRGGYVLTKAPHQLTMAEVVHALDGRNGRRRGPDGEVHSPSRPRGRSPRRERGQPARDGRSGRWPTAEAAPTRLRQAEWIARAVQQGVQERLMRSLDTVTLQDLCDDVRTHAADPLEHRYVFHI
jgi:Rrf2 family protein